MASQIIDDLTHVPNIIASLGLGIAEAQRHFDLDYLESMERLVVLAQSLLGGKKAAPTPPAAGTAAAKPAGPTQSAAGTTPAATPAPAHVDLEPAEQAKLDQFQSVIKDFLLALAPSRYQFTETTLSVKLDLAQHLDVSGGAGVSVGIGGVAVNASLAIGYGSDYRGAAECHTTLHAMPADPTTMRTLLDRATALASQTPSLPDRSKVDTAIQNQAGSIFEKMVGTKPQPIASSGTAASTTLAPSTSSSSSSTDSSAASPASSIASAAAAALNTGAAKPQS